MDMKTDNINYMQIAINESLLSMNNNTGKEIPKLYIGAVLVDHNNNILGKAHKKEVGNQRIHAEYQLLTSLTKTDNSHLKLYTTLEPCNFRHKINGNLPSCVDLILNKKLGTVIIGIYDPHPNINGLAIKALRSHGVKVIVLQDDPERYYNIITQINLLNKDFLNFCW